MLEKKQTDLLNQELDGTNSEKQRAVVRKVLEKNAEARHFYEDLQAMKSLFDGMKDADPPSSLKKRILNAVPARHARRAPVSSLPFLQTLATNSRYRYMYAFAGGAAVGILLFAIFTTGPPDTGDLVGTMAGQPAQTVQAEANVAIDIPQAKGILSARQVGPLITAELRLQSTQPLDVFLFFDRQVLRFDTFRQGKESLDRVVILEGELRIAHAASNDYTMTFLNRTQTIPMLTAQIRQHETLVSEYTLTLEPKKLK